MSGGWPGGRDCALKVGQKCGAEGPTRFSHFDCAISAPRLPLRTQFLHKLNMVYVVMY